jgi:hypothetical protein
MPLTYCLKSHRNHPLGSEVVFLVSEEMLTDNLIQRVLAAGKLPNMKAVARKSKVKSFYPDAQAEYECTCVRALHSLSCYF